MKTNVPPAIVSALHCGSPCTRLAGGIGPNCSPVAELTSWRSPSVPVRRWPAWPMIPTVCTDWTRVDS